MTKRRTGIVLAAVALVAVAGTAAAQTVYKSTMPDGKVIYGEKPAPGAARTEVMKPPPKESGMRTLPPGTPLIQAAPPQKKPTLDADGRAQAEEDLRLAQLKLREAEAALEAGKEPQPGERRPSAVAGRSQLNDAYWERQRSLEKAVTDVKAEIERLRGELGQN